MARKEKAASRRATVDEAAIKHLCQAAGISIPPDRVPGAVDRLNDMLAFLSELDALMIGEEAPAAVFDPSWEVNRDR